MSKFCTSCGTACDDNANVCTNCGTRFEAAQAAAPATEATATTKKTNIIAVAIAAVAVVLLVVLFASLLGGGYEKPIKNFYKGIEKMNWDKYAKAFTEDYADYFDENYLEDYDRDFEDYCESMFEMYEEEVGDDIKISYKIVGKFKYTEDQIEDIEDEYKDDYDEKIKISKAYSVVVLETMKGDEDKYLTWEEFTICKVKGEGWKIIK